jgi:hypothetical protein
LSKEADSRIAITGAAHVTLIVVIAVMAWALFWNDTLGLVDWMLRHPEKPSASCCEAVHENNSSTPTPDDITRYPIYKLNLWLSCRPVLPLFSKFLASSRFLLHPRPVHIEFAGSTRGPQSYILYSIQLVLVQSSSTFPPVVKCFYTSLSRNSRLLSIQDQALASI